MWKNKQRIIIVIALVCSLIGGCAGIPSSTMESSPVENHESTTPIDKDKNTIKKKKSGKNDNDDMGRVD